MNENESDLVLAEDHFNYEESGGTGDEGLVSSGQQMTIMTFT